MNTKDTSELQEEGGVIALRQIQKLCHGNPGKQTLNAVLPHTQHR